MISEINNLKYGSAPNSKKIQELRRGSFPKPNLKPKRRKDISLFICHHDSEIIDDLIQSLKVFEDKEGIKVKYSIAQNELECLYKLQNKYESYILFDALIIGDKCKLLDLVSVIKNLNEMMFKKVLNTIKVIPILSSDTDNNNEMIKSLEPLGVKDVIICPLSDSKIDNIIKSLI